MPTTANVVSAWQDANNAYLAISVVEAGGKAVEYIGSMPLADFQALPNAAAKKAALVAAVKSVRDAQQGAAQSAIGGISGTVAV